MIRPVDGAVTSRFGVRTHPVTGQRSHHDGTDYRAPEGTPVLAPEDGVVESVTESERGGLQLAVVSLDGQRRWLFLHLSRQDRRSGDVVVEGDVVALSGSTGVGTGPHLHVGLRVDGNIMDPESVLSAVPVATSPKSGLPLAVLLGVVAAALAARYG
jgi:murein DD-endopeptidase MepM/ murein hydrolase activator NlpD